MDLKTVKLAYFSPTGTTKKILEGIAEGIDADTVAHINLTIPATDLSAAEQLGDELVLLGVPVYEGRVAKTAISRLAKLKANRTPVVVVVVYGNRDYEDALIELKDLTMEMGFIPLAGGAFIGEHSFATDVRPIANGRPDTDDIEAAKAFGKKVRRKMTGLESLEIVPDLSVPGNSPYIDRDRSALEDRAASTDDENCTVCGTCETVCPVGAISINDAVMTDNMACILCCACIKSCPNGARLVADPMINKIANWVSRKFQVRREPEVFV